MAVIGKLNDTFDKGLAAVSVKSESLVESSRVRTAIASTQKAMNAAVTELGITFYNSWLAGHVDEEAVEEACKKVQAISAEIESLKARLEQIKLEESQILGSQHKPASVEVAAGNSVFCSNCGKRLDAGSRFCDECGTPVKP